MRKKRGAAGSIGRMVVRVVGFEEALACLLLVFLDLFLGVCAHGLVNCDVVFDTKQPDVVDVVGKSFHFGY